MSNNFAATTSKVLLPVLGNQSKSNYNYYPLLSGDKFPSFVLDRASFVSIKDKDLFTESFISSQDILDFPQPLVLAFLSVTDKVIDTQVWESLQSDIEIMGGRLLIVTNGNNKQFTHKIRRDNKLNIWEDHRQQLAEEAGLYDSQNPISDWLSGVDADIAIPAFYVIGKDHGIVFHHIDYALKTVSGSKFSESSFIRNLLTSVYQAASTNANYLRRAIS
ncbi:MAG: hypothetical protein DI598_00480 [Pseudopedobacter saltans]|uniref:Alkyl hydroperoxide reductase subunit C/ Thiol specific antioxidant domain-containing protein n=1 Tax=Pseudopedobacter saltans TaxID=151895 RepID=A0A2W5F916_9SPHI|nr:MAG: hypothetical protein DI598_00480 [Pseudopedobacter saltans]